MTSPSARRRNLLTWLGLFLMVGGAAVLGWIGWEIYGTTWMSKKNQGEIVQKLEKSWAGGKESASAADSRATAVVRIPRFGKDYAVPVLDGVSDAVLSSGFGHFEDSAGPGRKGNFALAAHRITHGEPLRRMPELQPGDEIIIDTRTHTYTYVLTSGGDDLVVTFEDGWVVDPLPTNPEPGGVQPAQTEGQKLITLTTCAALFHTDNRMVAFGVLESAEKR